MALKLPWEAEALGSTVSHTGKWGCWVGTSLSNEKIV